MVLHAPSGPTILPRHVEQTSRAAKRSDKAGQGIYRALVAYRAQQAAASGYQYLQVEASQESQPILARLGFTMLARTTSYR